MTSYQFDPAQLRLMFNRSRYDTSPDQSTIVTISMGGQIATLNEYINTLNSRVANALAGTGISLTFYVTGNGRVQMIASTNQPNYMVNGETYYYLSIIVDNSVATDPISLLLQLGWERSQFLFGSTLYTIIWTDQRSFNSTADNLPRVFPISGTTTPDSGTNSGGTQDTDHKKNQGVVIAMWVLLGVFVVIAIAVTLWVLFHSHKNRTTDYNTDQRYTDYDLLYSDYDSLGI